ncbi:MAG: peptidase MA family metallohydrolase [Chloroflexota bacterium]
MMLRIGRAISLMLAVLLAGAALPGVAVAASPSFSTPSVSANLGEPVTFMSQISGDDIAGVDVLVRLQGYETNVVLPADPGQGGTWGVTTSLDIASSAVCACVVDGESAPNTHFEFQFRVRAGDGTVTLGPVAQGVVEDSRYNWRTLNDGMVVVHWYSGTDSFAQDAGDLANEAIGKASQLLGTTLPKPVDLFVYDTQQALLDAVSPNRENIAGESHQDIQTMFVWLPPDQGIQDFNAEVVRHELTHLVFDAATKNPYHDPPRWLNEGIAVYLSVGYSDYYRSFVDGAVRDGSLIPLDGIAGFFPAPQDEFYLAYGEAVAAVDYFVRTYGDQKLWDLVRSYAQGMTDDDAFSAATGADAQAFNAKWFDSLGVDVPAPLGPQPAPPGFIPPDWTAGGATPGPTLAPGQTPPTPGPKTTATPRPGQPGPTGGDVVDGFTRVLTLTLWLVVIVLVVGLVGWLVIDRANRRRPGGF